MDSPLSDGDTFLGLGIDTGLADIKACSARERWATGASSFAIATSIASGHA